MPIDDLSIHGDSAARSNDDDLSGENCLSVHFDNLIASENAGRLRKEVEHVLNSTSSAPHRQAFKYLGCQNERGDDECGEELADRKRRDQGDGHGEFHRHAAFEDVLERFFEDGIAANECGDQTDDTYPMKRIPKMETAPVCSQRDK